MSARTSGGVAARKARAAVRPQPRYPRPYNFPRFERRRLASGLQLVVAPIPKLPIATVIALIDAGAVCDTRGLEGIAHLTADLLLEGTMTNDAVELVERFERLGASVEASVDWDSASFALTALTEHLGPAIALMGEVLRQPSFPPREVSRLKAERQAELLQLRAEPRGLADEMFSRFLYEERSRYSRPEIGTDTSLETITRDHVLAFYEARYRPAGITLVIAGDITTDAAVPLAQTAFGNWKGEAPAPVTTSDAPAQPKRAVHIVAKPDAPQSEIRIGNVGLPRNHPDYFPAVVMNAVLGGLFSSRINLNLREKHGYTYGAFSRIEWRRQAGPLVVSTAVGSDVTASAAREALKEIDRMRTEAITEDELSLATSYMDGVFPIRYETTDAIAGALATLVRYGLPDDFYDTYREHVRGVSTEDVLRAARAHLQPDAMQMVVVGDNDAIRDQLAALEFGPVAVYDTGGNPL